MELDLNSATLLIVDDNPTNLNVVADYLSAYGFRILFARDGETAIKRAQYVQPDLILLDVMMPPGINGFETCDRLKQDEATKHIPIIFMTALASEDDKVKGFEAGGVDYVVKPVQQAEVLARVITHLKVQRLTQTLQEQNQALEELNASKDKFFYIMSHDLRTPFNSLIGSSQLLLEEIGYASDEQNRELAERIYDSSKATYKLLENLLAWARLQLGRMVYEPTSILLQEKVDQIFAVLKETAVKKNIRLINTVNDGVTVYADPNMLDTILRNLVANALKFTSQGGRVTVGANFLLREAENLVEICIKDTGMGMSPAHLAMLFKLDQPVTTTGTNKEKGTGLGLLLCQEMVTKNGGEIWVTSQLGAGTTVKFTILAKSL